EKQDKSILPCYGRACTLWPRTMELLDQLDLAEELLQQSVVTRSGEHFVDGQRAKGGFMYANRMDKLGDTFYKFAVHIRQKKIEALFSRALNRLGHESHEQVEFKNYVINEKEEYPVEVHLKDLKTGKEYTVSAKHLVACDGGSSAVRSLPQTGISFEGDRTKHRWIRMDARIKHTNMPNSRYLNSVDSPTHGQILWCPIDSGMTRIGYVFSSALIEKYGGLEGVTEDAVRVEAQAAVAPFELEFESIDWWTIYGIGQRIASSFVSPQSTNRVFLAGDACHTHSSGSAQGLNTGVHDAVNLGWKLALALKGRPAALGSYDSERKSIVQQVIDNDKMISSLVSGQYPEGYKGSNKTTQYKASSSDYGTSSPINYSHLSSLSTTNAGDRGPDVYLSTSGLGEPIRLLKLLKNEGFFTFVVFAGNPDQTRVGLKTMRDAFAREDCWLRKKNGAASSFIRWMTIVASTYNNGGQEILGPIQGYVYLDSSRSAHDMYGIDVAQGSVVIFRPDSYVAGVVTLEELGTNKVGDWLGPLLGI
ncbi:FAD binding domain-containing protein, partial [Flagelloscypha sp. PMI_526]